MCMDGLIKKYLKTSVFIAILYLILSVYLYLRRGYFDLYIANKSLAGTSFIILCIVLLLGSLARLYAVYDKFIIYRKELGIGAFALAFFHSIISLFGLPQHFALERYLSFPITFIGGLSSLIILTLLFMLSFERIMQKINKKIWWHIQNWGVRLAGLLVFVHVIPMKYIGWSKWYAVGGGNELLRPFLPPAGLLVMSIGVITLLVRMIERLEQNLAKKLIVILTICYIVFLGFTLGTGLKNTPRALPLDWDTCIKLPNSKIMLSYPAVCVGTGNRTARENDQ